MHKVSTQDTLTFYFILIEKGRLYFPSLVNHRLWDRETKCTFSLPANISQQQVRNCITLGHCTGFHIHHSIFICNSVPVWKEPWMALGWFHSCRKSLQRIQAYSTWPSSHGCCHRAIGTHHSDANDLEAPYVFGAKDGDYDCFSVGLHVRKSSTSIRSIQESLLIVFLGQQQQPVPVLSSSSMKVTVGLLSQLMPKKPPLTSKQSILQQVMVS